MGPKSQTGNKRTRGSTSGTVERQIPVPRVFNRDRHSSGKHYLRYKELNKGTWQEKTFNISPTGQFAHILAMITSRGWDKLLTPETQIDPDIVREFYANALPNCDRKEMDARFSYTSYVRGVTVHFDRDTINTYLGNPLELEPPADPTEPTLCEYGEIEKNYAYNFSQIAKDILLKGKRFMRDKKNQEDKTARFKDMQLEAGIMFQFLVHNVVPRSHVTTTPMAALPLLWCIVKGKQVDIARVIAEQMKHVALCGYIGKITKLSFPGFLMGLLKDQGVVIPEPRTEKLKGIVDDRYIELHAKRLAGLIPHEPEPAPEEEDEQEIPQQEDHQQDTSQHSFPFDFKSFQEYMAQYEQRAEERARIAEERAEERARRAEERAEQRAHRREQRDQFIMDQNAALYRSHRTTYRSLYDARLDPAFVMMSPEIYHESCMWPGDRPIYPGGGSAPADNERTASHGDTEPMDDDADH